METMRIALRNSRAEDFEYCRHLYFAGMKTIIEGLKLDIVAQESGFAQQWSSAEVRIITLNDFDVGWVQTKIENGDVFVAQLFVDEPFQRQGIGTEVMQRITVEAACSGRGVSLEVVQINPAVRLYERLGFRITHTDDRKFHMRHDPDS